MRFLFITLALVLSSASVGAQKAPPLVPRQYIASFWISVPEGWEVRHDLGAMRLIAFSPREGAADTFRENLNVTFEGLPEAVSVSRYAESQLSQLQQGFSQFRLVEAADRTIAAHPARRLVYEHSYNGRRLGVVAYFLALPGRAYVLTGTAAAEEFDDYLPVFDQIANTFKP